MRDDSTRRPPLEEPLAELERHLIHAYLTGAGHDFHDLLIRDDSDARRILAEASKYASSKLSEIEARLHFVRSLHGQPA